MLIEHGMIASTGPTLEVRLPILAAEKNANPASIVREIERDQILSVLQKTGWRLMGKGGAAEILGLKRTTLYARMKKLGIHRPTG